MILPDIITDLHILRQKSNNILEHEYYIFDILEKVLDKYKNGMGLSAPQVGYLKRAFIIKVDGNVNKYANPEILETNGITTSIEGCLSIPDNIFRVSRFSNIFIKDDLHGECKIDGIKAIVFQHEFDHLEGRTLLETGVKWSGNYQ